MNILEEKSEKISKTKIKPAKYFTAGCLFVSGLLLIIISPLDYK